MENSQNNCFDALMEVSVAADDLNSRDNICETLPLSEDSSCLNNSIDKKILSNDLENDKTDFLISDPLNICTENLDDTLSALKENSQINDQLPKTILSNSVSSIEPQMECVSSSDFQNSEKEETNVLIYREKDFLGLSIDEIMYSGDSTSDSEEDSSSVISSSSESEIELNFSTDSDNSSDLGNDITEPSVDVATPVPQKIITNGLLDRGKSGMCSYCILNNNSSESNNMINKSTSDKNKDICNKLTAHTEGDINLYDNSSSNNCKITIIEIDKIVENTIEKACEIAKNTESNNSTISEECTNSITNNVENIYNASEFCTCWKNKENMNRNVNESERGKGKKSKKSALDDIDLPPIEDLHISVEENEAKPIGTIMHTVGNLVVVRTYPGIPAIDLDSVLFLDHGKRALGSVDDVFGQIYEPHYVVRFNSTEHIKEKKIEKDQIVYYAPQTDHTSFVILNDLICVKGSDASWKDNREPPTHLLDYSDDEEERNARAVLKAKKKQANGDVAVIKEVNHSSRNVRNEDINPFAPSSAMRCSFPRPRFTAPRYCGNDRPIYRAKRHLAGPERSGVRFGGPPNLREGVHSPFIPQFSQVDNINQGFRGAWSRNSERSNIDTREMHHNIFRPNIHSSLSSTPPPSPNIFSVPPPPRSPYQFTGPPQSPISRQTFGATPPPVLGQNVGSPQTPGQNFGYSPLTSRSNFATPPPTPGQNFGPPSSSPASYIGAPQHIPSPMLVGPPHMPPPQSPSLFVGPPPRFVPSPSQSPGLQVASFNHMPPQSHPPAQFAGSPQNVNQPPPSQSWQAHNNLGTLPQSHVSNFVHSPQLQGQNILLPSQTANQNFVPPLQAPGQNFLPPLYASGQNFIPPPQTPSQNFVPPPALQASGQNFIPPPQALSQNFLPPPQVPNSNFGSISQTLCQNMRPLLQTPCQTFIPPPQISEESFRPPFQYAGPHNMPPSSNNLQFGKPPPPFNPSIQAHSNLFHSTASPTAPLEKNSPPYRPHIQPNQETYQRW